MSDTGDSLAVQVPLFRRLFESHAAHMAMLNFSGDIIAVNQSWRDFGIENGLRPDYDCVGVNYLDICAAAAAERDPYAEKALTGLLSMFNAGVPRFSMIYACPSPTESRWFKFWAASQRPELDAVIIAHTFLGEAKPANADRCLSGTPGALLFRAF